MRYSPVGEPSPIGIVEGKSIHYVLMAFQSQQFLAALTSPNLACPIIAPGYETGEEVRWTLSCEWCPHSPGAGLVGGYISEWENVCPQHFKQLELPPLGLPQFSLELCRERRKRQVERRREGEEHCSSHSLLMSAASCSALRGVTRGSRAHIS